MAKFKLKPKIVEAVRYNGGNLAEVANMLGISAAQILQLDALKNGDWVVKDGQKTAVRMPDEVFRARYELAEVTNEG